MTTFHIGHRHNPRYKGDEFPYELTSSGEPAGPRLVRAPGAFPLPRNPKADPSPHSCTWSRYRSSSDAEEAAGKLQRYLDESESGKKTKKKADTK